VALALAVDVPWSTSKNPRKRFVLDLSGDAEVVQHQFQAGVSQVYLGAEPAPLAVPKEGLKSPPLFRNLERSPIKGGDAIDLIYFQDQ
jgi:hypothetical protein